jgi:hypothetical protein
VSHNVHHTSLCTLVLIINGDRVSIESGLA